MNRIIASVLTGALLPAMCLAQSSADMQSGAAASQNVSVSASQSGVKADSNTSTSVSQQTGVTGKNGDSQAASAGQLQAGSTVQAELTRPVDARKNKPGDEVMARTTQDVKSNGYTVLPKGSKIVGHVTEVQARGKGQKESRVAMAFERAVLKNGSQVPMSLTLQAIGSSQANAAAAMDDPGMAGSTTADESVSGMASSSGSATRGALGGVTSTTGRVVNTAGTTAGGALNTTHSTGAGLASVLTSSSQGVVGLPGLTLSSASAVSSSTSADSVISSNSGNVHLDSGTRMILRVTGQ